MVFFHPYIHVICTNLYAWTYGHSLVGWGWGDLPEVLHITKRTQEPLYRTSFVLHSFSFKCVCHFEPAKTCLNYFLSVQSTPLFTPSTSNMYQTYAPHLSAMYPQQFTPSTSNLYQPKTVTPLSAIQDPPQTFYPFYFKSVPILCTPLVCHSDPPQHFTPFNSNLYRSLCTPLV